jgi:hypothetical protein
MLLQTDFVLNNVRIARVILHCGCSCLHAWRFPHPYISRLQVSDSLNQKIAMLVQTDLVLNILALPVLFLHLDAHDLHAWHGRARSGNPPRSHRRTCFSIASTPHATKPIPLHRQVLVSFLLFSRILIPKNLCLRKFSVSFCVTFEHNP